MFKLLAGLSTAVGFLVLSAATHGFAFWAGKRSREISEWWKRKMHLLHGDKSDSTKQPK